MKTPILGSSYVARTVNAADNRMINLFPEPIPEGGKEPAFLQRAPGLTLVSHVTGTDPVLGVLLLGQYLYVATSTTFYKLAADDPSTVVFSLAFPGGGPTFATFASMAENGKQVFVIISSTVANRSYVYDIATNTLTYLQVGVYPNFPGARSVVFMDGYFVINEPDTQKVWVSALYDGLTWTALHFASAERSSDNVVGLCVNNGELWVFGTNTTEVWYNAGTPNFPFAPIQGAFSEIGCASPWCIAKIDNAIFWVNNDSLGNGIVYRSRGYSGERISTHAIEWYLQNGVRTPDGPNYLINAVAYTYQSNGHSFYLLTSPFGVIAGSSNAYGFDRTLVYDCSTQVWHERQSVDPNTNSPSRHWGTCSVFVGNPVFTNYQVVGSCFGGLYMFDQNSYQDEWYVGGVVTAFYQYWVRSWRALPAGQNNLTRSAHHSLQVDFRTGVGGSTIDSQVFLRWSDDGGNTWNSQRAATLGVAGDYGKRIIWRRLGMTTKLRDRVYELSGTDACELYIMGAELQMSPTNA